MVAIKTTRYSTEEKEKILEEFHTNPIRRFVLKKYGIRHTLIQSWKDSLGWIPDPDTFVKALMGNTTITLIKEEFRKTGDVQALAYKYGLTEAEVRHRLGFMVTMDVPKEEPDASSGSIKGEIFLATAGTKNYKPKLSADKADAKQKKEIKLLRRVIVAQAKEITLLKEMNDETK